MRFILRYITSRLVNILNVLSHILYTQKCDMTYDARYALIKVYRDLFLFVKSSKQNLEASSDRREKPFHTDRGTEKQTVQYI